MHKNKFIKITGYIKDLTNQTFGRLTVIGAAERDQRGRIRWLCICNCGTNTTVASSDLCSGNTQSCGCLSSELIINRNSTHGLGKPTGYSSWAGMKSRCDSPNNFKYSNYGGRGISYDQQWSEFENFYADMGDRPEGSSLDRINNDGNYCKDNCKWSTPEEQANNTRSNVILTLEGVSLNVAQWTSRMGFRKGLIHNRLRCGWSASEAILTPTGTPKNSNVTG